MAPTANAAIAGTRWIRRIGKEKKQRKEEEGAGGRPLRPSLSLHRRPRCYHCPRLQRTRDRGLQRAGKDSKRAGKEERFWLPRMEWKRAAEEAKAAMVEAAMVEAVPRAHPRTHPRTHPGARPRAHLRAHPRTHPRTHPGARPRAHLRAHPRAGPGAQGQEGQGQGDRPDTATVRSLSIAQAATGSSSSALCPCVWTREVPAWKVR